MTVREPAQLVLANVHYHLGQGAAEIHVFLDDPVDPVGELLAGIDRLSVHRCDADHWDRLNKGRRPTSQTRRQSLNATLVYANSTVDWLVHMDADEFLFQKHPLAEELEYVPRQPGYLGFRVRERAFINAKQAELFDGAFRVPFYGRDAMLSPLFGELAPFLTHGMSGHAAGKACVPVGRDLRMSIHGPRTLDGGRLPPLHSSSTVLLHFDGLTRLHWAVKMLRYADGKPEGLVGPHRLAQLGFMRDGCEGLAEILEFHDVLKSVETDDSPRLLALGLLEHLPFEVGDDARKAVEDAGMSLDAEAFDNDLRNRSADILDGLKA
ncbi:MAG: glycosyltransferase family 2 protein [Paracoccaceae bacterium]|nr:glycosyltransferase family 2 protein [Paracoccaceae bacterium]